MNSFLSFIGAVIVAFAFSVGISLLYEWLFYVFAVCFDRMGFIAFVCIILALLLKNQIQQLVMPLLMYALGWLTRKSNSLTSTLLTLIFVYGTINAMGYLFFNPDEAIIERIGDGLLYYIGAICTFIAILKDYIMVIMLIWTQWFDD